MQGTPLEYAQMLASKGDGDLRSARLLLDAGEIDTACFHVQQAAEKFLKALLASRNVPYPFIHDLRELLTLAVAQFPVLNEFETALPMYTPFAVTLRYDDAGLPSHEEATEAIETVAWLRALTGQLVPELRAISP